MKKRGTALALALVLGMMGSVQPAAAEVQPTETETVSGQRILAPSGISKDSRGQMYIADRDHHVLLRRTKKGIYKVLAGQEGVSGYQDGAAKEALFMSPWDVVPYKNGWAVSDTENHAIRLYQSGQVSTLAGSGQAGYKDAKGKNAGFDRPTGMAVGDSGELYVADTGNHVIRKIDTKGRVTVYAGSKKGCADGKPKEARFNEPTGLFYYKGTLYVADSGNHRICGITVRDGAGAVVETVAGSRRGIEGDARGKAWKARFSNPQEVFLYKDVLYIADTGNGSVKKMNLKGKRVASVADAFSLDGGRTPAEPCGMMVQGGYLYVGDIFTQELLKIDL